MPKSQSDPLTQIHRVRRPKSAAQASYDKMSRWYDTLASSEAKFRDVGLAKLNAQSGEKILELGFGTGHGLVALGQAVGEMGKVYGVDLSPKMCAIAQERVAQAGLSARVTLVCGDAAQLDFADNLFDAVFMSFILELFDTPEIPVVMAEVGRVLRDNGRCALVTLAKEIPSTMVRLYEWGHDKFPNFFDCRPIFIQPILQAAGFTLVDSTRMAMWGLPVDITVAHK